MSLNDKGICPQEAKPQSDARWGVVRDKEILARMIRTCHIEDGVVQNSILTITDLQKRDGWSFVRKDRANDSRMRAIGKNKYDGYVTFKASVARKILDNDKNQALCIIDDAKKDFAEHALAKGSKQRCPAEIREIREELIEEIRKEPYVCI